MTRGSVCSCLRLFARSAFILLFIISLQLTVYAADPAPVQAAPAGPRIWLQDNHPLAVLHTGVAARTGLGQPLALASADIDGDGIADLVVGYSATGGGVIAIHHGNIDAFAPQSDASFQAIGRGEFPSPFLLEAATFAVPVRPDFIALGNFLGSGNQDLVVAAKGGTAFYVFAGDGKGNFGSPQTINLPGGVTSLAAGQFGNTHQPSIVTGVSTGKNSSELVLFGGTLQGLTPVAAQSVTGAISNILFGDFGGEADAAFLAGGKVQILSSATGKLTSVSVPFSAAAFALGSFVHDRNGGAQIALLGNDGSVQIVARSDFDPRMYTVDEFGAIRRAKIDHLPSPAFVPERSVPTGWKIVESFPAVGSVGAGQTPVFFQTRVASNGADDIMWLNAGTGQMALISHPDLQPGAQTFVPGQVSVKPYSGAPVAALPLRINVDGRPGVMALHQGEIAPSMLMPIPDPTFFVNRTDDPIPTSPITNACNNVSNTDTSSSCSLREAVLRANALAGTDTIQLAAQTYTLTIAKVTGDFSGNFGALYINDSVNIVGQVNGSGNPTSIIQAGTIAYNAGTPNGVDMVMAVNEDINPITNATASISNVVIQNGHNLGTHGNDGDGGCMEFDTGSSGNANLTLTNVTLQNCDTTQGNGAGIAIFNFTNPNNGLVTFTNSTVQGNSAVDSTAGVGAGGGGIWVSQDARASITNTQVLNNNATEVNGTGKGIGGGLFTFTNTTSSRQTVIHSSTISGNKSAGSGGGIFNSVNLLVDQGTVISNNTAGTDGTNPIAGGTGGGLYDNTSSNGCPGACTDTATLTKVTITGNTASASGGGIYHGNNTGAGSLTVSFSRLAGNTAQGSGINLFEDHSVATVSNNWWGTNNPSSTITNSGGTVTFDPFIVLTHSATPAKIRINQSTTLTADMSKDNHGNGAALSGNLDEIVGLPITFDNPVLGSIPQAQPETLGNPVPTATATFNAGGTSGRGSAHATVDQAVIGANSNLIAAATEAGTTVTITTVGIHNFATNETVVISGVGVAGYNGTFTVTSTPTPTTFTYTAAAGLGASSGGLANVGIIILEPPQITKSFGAATIPVNGTTTINFSINNPNVVAINASFTDTLPTGLQVAATPGVTNTCGGTVTATAGSGSISFSNNLTPIGVCTISVNITGTVDNNYTNSVQILSADAGNGNTSSANLTVINPPHIAKAFGAATIPLNGTTTLSFTVDSNGNQNLTQTGVAFTDNLPAGLVNATPSNVTTNCAGGTATAVSGGASVTLSGASIPPVSSCTLSVTVQGTTAGVKNNSVQVTSTNAGTGNTSNASITVIGPPTISKAFGAASIPLNGTTTVTFTINNPNTTAAGDLTGVAFSDTLPNTTGTLVVATPPGVANTCNGIVTATAGTGVISLSGGTVTHNASCTLSVNVTGTAAGDANNTTGAITSTEGGTGTASNTATVKIVAPPTISKAFGAATIPLNGTTTATFTITNPAANTTSETGIAFSDTLTGGLQIASTPGVSNTCGGTVTAAPNSTSISLSGGSIATPGNSCTISVNVTGTQAGTVTNTTGAVSSTNGGTGATSNTATLIVAAPPTISKQFGAATIPLNGTTSLTFNVQNPNTGVTLNGIAFTDNLPAGLVIASTPNLNNTCGGTATAVGGSGSVSLSAGTLASSASCTVSVNVQGTTAGVKNNSVQVTSTEGGTGNTSNASITVVGPPVIIKAFGAASIPLNGSTSLSFTIQNNNTTVALSGVGFSDTLPAGLVISTPNGLTGSCGSGTITATQATNVISLSGGSIAASSSCTFSVNVTGVAAGLQNNTTGNVTSTEGGTGGTASASVKVEAPPSIAKVFNPSTIALNATTSLTFTITNPAANVDALTGVAFTDTLPTGLTVANATATVCGGTLTTTAPTGISLSGATVNTSSQCQFSVTVTGAASGQYTNTTGNVTSTNGGTGNTASANLTVASPPTISKGFAPATITQGGTSTLTFSINNPNANVALTGIAFTDNLPSGVVVAATPNASNTCGGTFAASAGATSLSLSGGTLAGAGSCTMSVDVQGTTAGIKLNTTSAITSNEGGTGATSNTASLTVNKADTTTTVTSSVNPSVFGQLVTFTATVSAVPPGLGTPTGTVTFLDGVNPIGTATLSIGGQATFTTSALAVGSHTITTSYGGDGNFNGSTGSLTGNPQVVNEAFSATTLISSANPSVFGQTVTFTATVSAVAPGSGIPTGTVTFLDGVSPIGTGTLDISGQATFTTSALAIGNHTITTTYPGDGNFTSSTGTLTASGGQNGNPQVVTKPNTTIAITTSSATITLGDTVTFTATVTVNPPGTGTPTGLVTFFNGSTPIGSGVLNVSDQATFSTSLLPVGSDSITAIYQGDANFNASPLSAPTTETVNLRGTATSVGLNPTTVGAGQASTITLTVTDGGTSTPPGTADVFSATGPPATGRTGFTSTLFADGLVLVAGGADASNVVLNSAEIYSVSGGTFSSTGNLNSARTGAVAVLLPNGKVLVAGGSSDGTSNGALNTAELFDPVAGTFAVAGSGSSNVMTAARFGATATLLNTGKVLIAGGINSGGVLNSAELYDPSTDTFTATGNLNAARTGASATLLGTGTVLVAGGSSDGTATGALSSAEVFDPAGNAGAGSFTSVAGSNPTLAAGRWQPEAALLLSGKVLIAGGQNSGGPLTSADLYDPVADSFTATAHAMNEARANGSAIALPDGMVLLPGGTSSKTVDLYDADSDQFDSTTGALLHAENGLVVTQLNNGQALVVGINVDLDINNVPANTPDAELYSPSFNPLGTVVLGSSEPTDVFGPACVLKPSTSTASTCTSTVTPEQVATSPHTITGTYPADAVHSGSSNSASLTVVPTAPPTISKSFSAANVAQNSTVGVSFTIVNPNPAATLTGISFTDSLPAGLVVATPNNLNSDCGGTVTAVAGSSSISLSGGTLAPPGPPPLVLRGKTVRNQTTPATGQCVITVSLLVTGTGTISNTTGPISATESGPGNPSNTATINVVQAPTVNKAFGAAQIQLNASTSLTFNIANPNTATSLVNTSLTDALPSGLVVANPNGLTGSCVASSVISASAGSSSISLSSLNLAAAASCSFSVNVTGTTGGTKNNTTSPITATFDDGSGLFVPITGGTASASVLVLAPDLAITKTHTGNFQVGHVNDAWTITVNNNAGGAATNGTVTVVDNLPAPLHQTAMSGTGWSCTLSTLTCTRSDALAIGASYPPITLAVAVPLNAGSSVINTVTVSGGGETNTANDTATDPTNIDPLPGPPLTITPVIDHATVGDGSSATFTFTVNSATTLLGGINFSCAGLPALSTCNFDKQGETDSTSLVTLTINTTPNTASNVPVQIGRAAPVLAVLLFPLIGLVSISSGQKKSSKKVLRTLGIFGGLILLIALMGCGGRKSNGTPTGSFPIQVTAASSATPSVQASTTVTLTVQ